MPTDVLELRLAGTNLIEASAGTGKTQTITDLYLRLLLEQELGVGEILVVTYTNAATAELRMRIRARLHEALIALAAAIPESHDRFLQRLIERRRVHGRADADQARLLLALHSFDEAAIFTIHGFCQRVLRENAFESGAAFDAEVLTDESLLRTEVVQDFWVRTLHDAPEQFVRFLQEQDITLKTLQDLAAHAVADPDIPVLPEHDDPALAHAAAEADQEGEAALHAHALRLERDLVDYCRREMRRRKERARLESYDDLLHRVAEALRGDGGPLLAQAIRGRFRAALIDEFQDTDPIQYDIFRRVYLHTDAVLFLIGDPKQSIYAFRGADVFAYMQAKRDAGRPPHTLGTNYRSDPMLVRALNTLFGRLGSPFPFLFDAIPFLAVEPAPDARDRLGGSAAGQPPLQILFVPRHESVHVAKTSGGITKGWADDHLADLIAAEIVRFLGSGATLDGAPVEPRNIAVLCRKNRQASGMQDALRRLGVPSVLQGDASVFESSEAEQVERLLRAIADPGDAVAIRAALATPILGRNAHDIYALEGDDAQWDEWVRHFQDWNDLWTRRNFITAFRALLDSQAVHERLLRLFDGERRLTNVLHLTELLHAASTQERRGPNALVYWLSQMRTDVAARSALGSEAAQIRLESDAAAVMLTTVHKSKGLQYPIVYCPYLWDGRLLFDADKQWVRFHDRNDRDRMKLDIGSSDHDAHARIAARETLAENLRLLYVALTRARHRCTIVWGAFNNAETSALGYLLHAQSDDPDRASVRIKEMMKRRDDAPFWKDLRTLAAGSEGIAVEDLRLDGVARYTAPSTEMKALQCRTAARRVDRAWRVSSFSGLTAAEDLSRPAEEGIDHDALAESAEAAAAGDVERIVLHEFPGGAQAGDCIHHILEALDFQADGSALREQVSLALTRFGFEAKWVEPLSQALGAVLATPLDGAHARSFALRDIARHRRLSELEFILPVERLSPFSAAAPGQGGSHPRNDMLTSNRLADVFACHASPAVPSTYADRVRALGFAPLTGFLKGYIDLVFEHQGRWYLVDYKSNFLGPRRRDYESTSLATAMTEHHYYLQYHLYLVALHRYLRTRLPAYSYNQHFGGVYYLFLRGIAPACGRNGVFFDRPSLEMVEGLSAILTAPEELS